VNVSVKLVVNQAKMANIYFLINLNFSITLDWLSLAQSLIKILPIKSLGCWF